MNTNITTAMIIALALFTISACQVNPQAYRPLDVTPGTLMGDRPGGVVSLDEEGTPNPVGVRNVTTRADLFIPRHFSGLDEACQGFVASRPAFTITTEEGVANGRVRALGDAQILLVDDLNGEVRCIHADEEPTLEIADWPAGNYRVYAGMPERYAKFTYAVTFEDLDGPLTLPWHTDEAVVHIDGVGELETPHFEEMDFEQTWARTEPAIRPPTDCLDAQFETDSLPAAKLTVERAGRVNITTLGAQASQLLLVGPVGEDARDLPAQCLDSAAGPVNLNDGEYFLFFAFAEPPPAEPLQLVVYDERSEIDPGALATEPQQDLPVAMRALANHYPFLSMEALWENDTLRAELFDSAPPELFVGLQQEARDAQLLIYAPIAEEQPPNGDLDEEHVDERTESETEPAELGDEPQYRAPEEGQHPAAGEVVLLLDREGHILTADGVIFSAPVESLVGAEQLDELAAPRAPRASQLNLQEKLRLFSDEEPALIREYETRHQDYERCEDQIFEETEEELAELQQAPDVDHDAVDALVEETRLRAQQECDLAGLEQADAELLEQLRTTRTQRRATALDHNRDRIRSLFD